VADPPAVERIGRPADAPTISGVPLSSRPEVHGLEVHSPELSAVVPALRRLGYDEAWATAAASADPDADPARVVRTDRSHVLVDAGDAVIRAAIVDRHEPPTTGDWVVIAGHSRPDQLGPRVVVVLPRRTAVHRGAGRADVRGQLLAANVDTVLITHSLAEAPNLSRLERYLALAWSSGAKPVVVLTKADLSTDPAGDAAEVAANAPGAEVVYVCAVADDAGGPGLDPLRQVLRPVQTAALIGPSGTGKSTLVNALSGADLLATRDVRSDGKGRHTTVTRELIALPNGALIIDTPGLRGVQMWDAEAGIADAFSDIAELVEQCRFTDCGHDSEPGCAVTAALRSGALSERRMASFRKLMREQTWLRMRYDARLRAEERARWKSLARQVRGRARP
jgi:ribosome biogenesis GTPase